MAKIPQAEGIARLPLPEQYSVIELFRGTMIRHSAVVYRDDCPDGLKSLGSAGAGWFDHVPIRMSDTLCIQDQVPPGTAGILINRTHTNKDLFLVIDATEKTLLDAIDGQRTIRDIIERTLPSEDLGAYVDRVSNFFEQLWWYDQIVFDASRNGSSGNKIPERSYPM